MRAFASRLRSLPAMPSQPARARSDGILPSHQRVEPKKTQKTKKGLHPPLPNRGERSDVRCQMSDVSHRFVLVLVLLLVLEGSAAERSESDCEKQPEGRGGAAESNTHVRCSSFKVRPRPPTPTRPRCLGIQCSRFKVQGSRFPFPIQQSTRGEWSSTHARSIRPIQSADKVSALLSLSDCLIV